MHDLSSAVNYIQRISVKGAAIGKDMFPLTCTTRIIPFHSIDGAESFMIPPERFDPCLKRDDFAFNFMLGQAYLMTVAALSGLSQRECMLSWLLSQVSGFVVLFQYGSASLWQWRQNLFMCLITSFLCSLFLSAGAERHRRICVLLAADTTLTSMSQQCIEARRKWIEKVHTLNPLATCVLSGIRREVQLRNILAVSIDAISRVSVSSDGIVCLHLPAGSPEKERFKSFVGEDVPLVFDDLVLQADKDRWRSYVMRCKGGPECNNSSSLEVTRLQLHNLVAEVVLSVDNENGGH